MSAKLFIERTSLSWLRQRNDAAHVEPQACKRANHPKLDPTLMRPGFFLYIAVTLAVAFFAFLVGEFWAKKEAERVAGLVISSEAALHQATAFQLSRNALRQLKDRNLGDAELLIARLAKLQALGLIQCAKSMECKRSVGNKMPGDAEIEEVASSSWNK